MHKIADYLKRASNDLNPEVKGIWQQVEDRFLQEKYVKTGSNWHIIMRFFQGRSAADLTNK
jgi:hypothetical protein